MKKNFMTITNKIASNLFTCLPQTDCGGVADLLEINASKQSIIRTNPISAVFLCSIFKSLDI